jgi:hypothetical protein
MRLGYARTSSGAASRRGPALLHELSCGVIAGQVAGAAMAVVLMALFATFLDASAFAPLQVIGQSIPFPWSTESTTFYPVALGILVHQLGPSFAWGLVFGLLVWLFPPRNSIELLLQGVLVGTLAEVVDVDILLPAAMHCLVPPSNSTLVLSLAVYPGSWTTRVPIAVSWVSHLAFGAALSIYPWNYDPLVKTFN